MAAEEEVDLEHDELQLHCMNSIREHKALFIPATSGGCRILFATLAYFVSSVLFCPICRREIFYLLHFHVNFRASSTLPLQNEIVDSVSLAAIPRRD